MNPKITAEQREALEDGPGPILVEDAKTSRKYFLIEASYFELLQARSDIESIKRGIEDAKAGRMTPLDEAFAEIKASIAKRSAS